MAEVVQVVQDFKQALLLRDARQMQEMTAHWMRIERNLQDKIEALAAQLSMMKDDGQLVKQWRLNELDRYRELLAQLRVEMSSYLDDAERQISATQSDYGELGILNAQDAIRAAIRDARIMDMRFNNLPVDAVENMAGL